MTPAMLGFVATVCAQLPPHGHKIAFLGDQSLSEEAVAVLKLIGHEGADAVVHLGDFDYDDDPEAWEAQINDVLGENFPYFSCVGNHDDDHFYGPGGYQEKIVERFNRIGLGWEGDLGSRSTHTHAEILYVLLAPDLFGDGDSFYAPYLRERLAASDQPWRIAGWHVLMRKMQVGDKSDQSGWGVYEEARQGGAIVATAHEHSYARTFPLSHAPTQAVAEATFDFSISRDDPVTSADEGITFAFHNGLGGHSIRDQERCSPSAPPYGCNGEWASIYTSDQDADYGALFLTFFNCKAYGCFKNIHGGVIDEFWVRSTIGICDNTCPGDANGDDQVDVLDLLALLSTFGNCPGCPGDADDNDFIGVDDIGEILDNWGQTCG